MNTTEETALKVWICDDGFWKYNKSNNTDKKPQKSKKRMELGDTLRKLVRKVIEGDAKGGEEEKTNDEEENNKIEIISDNGKPEKQPIPGFTETFQGNLLLYIYISTRLRERLTIIPFKINLFLYIYTYIFHI